MILIFCLLTTFAWANPQSDWVNTVRVIERHEIYGNNKPIEKPRNTWQTLFGVVFRNNNLTLSKDCIFYFVPGTDSSGILKRKRVNAQDECAKQLFMKGDQEWTDIKSFYFSISDSKITMQLNFKNFKAENWNIDFFNAFKKPSPQMHMSSAELRSPKMIFLVPKKSGPIAFVHKREVLPDGEKCHDIDESCNEKSISKCDYCSDGWFEMPNGCSRAPKICGQKRCGGKRQPACRRGMIWQRNQTEFNCRSDDSFAFCQRGLKIQCQGPYPYCI